MTSSDDDLPLIGATTTTTSGHQTPHNFHRQLTVTTHLLSSSSQPTPITTSPPPPPESTGDGYIDGGGAFCSQPMVAVPYDPNRSRINGKWSDREELSDVGTPQPPPPPESNGDGYRNNGGAFCSQPMVVVPYDRNSDPNISRINGKFSDREREELSDGGTPYNNHSKKHRLTGSSSGGGEYRKDREEWSDSAIACLLDAYLDKFLQLNRGNLRGRDWEEVAAIVSERCEKQTKSVEQCKNKVDNLKKRYKLERNRMMNTNGGNAVSHWPWFKTMEQIVGNLLPLKAVACEENSADGMISPVRQSSKRYATSCPITTIKPKPVTNARWRRVVFRISGASLAGNGAHSVDPKVAMLIAREVSIACHVGVEVAIVVGGSNFFCGNTWVTDTGMDRSTAYQIGMMATVMNSILIQSALEKLGVQTRLQSAISMPEVFEPYSKQRAIRHLEKGRVVIFGGIGAGSGNPLFSTDSAAALRASEIHADAFVKGTNADGASSSSMDIMAANFCQENGIPVVIFNLLESGNISRALSGEHVGTLIDQTGKS